MKRKRLGMYAVEVEDRAMREEMVDPRQMELRSAVQYT